MALGGGDSLPSTPPLGRYVNRKAQKRIHPGEEKLPHRQAPLASFPVCRLSKVMGRTPRSPSGPMAMVALLCTVLPDMAVAFCSQVLSSAAIRSNRKLVALAQAGEVQMPRLPKTLRSFPSFC